MAFIKKILIFIRDYFKNKLEIKNPQVHQGHTQNITNTYNHCNFISKEENKNIQIKKSEQIGSLEKN